MIKDQRDLKRSIFVTFKVEGIHCYPDAPEGVEFLKHPHRHIFHFNVEVEVFHDDRDIEFILFKRELEEVFPVGQIDHKSCEMLALDVVEYVAVVYPGRWITATVSEDGENGGTIRYVPQSCYVQSKGNIE
jgi:hypothetical protein